LKVAKRWKFRKENIDWALPVRLLALLKLLFIGFSSLYFNLNVLTPSTYMNTVLYRVWWHYWPTLNKILKLEILSRVRPKFHAINPFYSIIYLAQPLEFSLNINKYLVWRENKCQTQDEKLFLQKYRELSGTSWWFHISIRLIILFYISYCTKSKQRSKRKLALTIYDFNGQMRRKIVIFNKSKSQYFENMVPKQQTSVNNKSLHFLCKICNESRMRQRINWP
jgi:hypothetical protein